MLVDVIKVVLPAALAFAIGIALTPLLSRELYRRRAWKKSARSRALDGTDAPVFNALHREREVGVPRMGGVIIWLSSLITIGGIWLAAKFFPNDTLAKLDFLSRNQTWIPLMTLVAGGLVGLIDDFLEVAGKGSHVAGGLSLRKRLLVVAAIAAFVGWWFFAKLDVSAIGLFGGATLSIGALIVPLFVLVALALYAGGIIDGIDGLAGGVFASIFLSYAGIAFAQGQVNLAAFCATVAGAILAFLWFNIPPARFYMSETGTMGLTMTLAVVAFMTDTLGGGHGLIALPVIAALLLVTVASVVLQLLSKKFRGKKLFRIAPLHHHFEAVGWPPYKVAMRYFVLGIIFALTGLIFALL